MITIEEDLKSSIEMLNEEFKEKDLRKLKAKEESSDNSSSLEREGQPPLMTMDLDNEELKRSVMAEEINNYSRSKPSSPANVRSKANSPSNVRSKPNSPAQDQVIIINSPQTKSPRFEET
jgi:hypothetical protein